MSRTSDRVCMLELNTDMTRIVCSKCGWEVPAGTNPNTVRECGGCERVVVCGDIPRLYLIGPVTGKPNDNRETFRAVRAILRKDGYECMPCRPWREWLSPAAPAATMADAPAPQPLLAPCC